LGIDRGFVIEGKAHGHESSDRGYPLSTDGRFASDYAAFLRDMVYGETPDFKTALATVSALADGLRRWS